VRLTGADSYGNKYTSVAVLVRPRDCVLQRTCSPGSKFAPGAENHELRAFNRGLRQTAQQGAWVSVPERVPESAAIIGLCIAKRLYGKHKTMMIASNVLEGIR